MKMTTMMIICRVALMAIALSLLVLISMIDGSIACPASEIAAAGARDAAEQLICEDNDGISTTVRAQVAGIAYPMNDTITLNVPGYVLITEYCLSICACGAELIDGNRTGAQSVFSTSKDLFSTELVTMENALQRTFREPGTKRESILLIPDENEGVQTEVFYLVSNPVWVPELAELTMTYEYFGEETSVLQKDEQRRRRLLGNSGITQARGDPEIDAQWQYRG